MSKRIVTLGTWDGTPIQWIVLKESKLGSVVISKDSLFQREFDSKNRDWPDSDIRAYLNREFFQQAFRAEERKRIINTIIDGKKTDIFLLSKEEVENWMTSNERNCSGNWSLRSQYNSDCIDVVYDNDRDIIGDICAFVHTLKRGSRTIRPAFILDL
ncbi:DUF6273 domain-containing protein [Ruminococcus sp. CAG:330]|uniref:DUF6273 domain-containing protein n=1 Tax=Ruminococcus sp. CAG:330 TaxID=1262954 RepID=UPI00033EE1F3|nr:DUF6273 domain-containing protein [Ruminococcus sp. CAG:330]CDE12018.1 putative uncharacterized protein [Ruminococcus sp. CAG:330]